MTRPVWSIQPVEVTITLVGICWICTNYPAPELYLYDAQRATVLGEYGGIGWVVQGHIWEPDRNWGYIQFNSSKEVTDEYVNMQKTL